MNVKLDKKGSMMENNIDPIATILIIEDNEDLLELESFHLLNEGYRILGVTSTQGVEALLEKEEVDLMLVDRMLPQVEGSEFVAYLRSKGMTTPVMFVSAKDKDSEVEEGYINGADDYLRKPFNIHELVYRVKAILRRTCSIKYDRVRARDIVMDFNTRKTYVDNAEVDLTKLEFELLVLFVQNKNSVLERDYILKNIWKGDENIQKRTVNVTLNRLRKKIDPKDEKGYIIPIRGIGYKFN